MWRSMGQMGRGWMGEWVIGVVGRKVWTSAKEQPLDGRGSLRLRRGPCRWVGMMAACQSEGRFYRRVDGWVGLGGQDCR